MMSYWDRPVRSKQYSIVNKRNLWEDFRSNPTEKSFLDFGQTWWANRHFGDPKHFVRKRILDKGYSPTDVRNQLVAQADEGPSAINADFPGMGVATLSELLETIDPSQYATLNSKSRDGLRALGYPVPGDNPSTAAYQQFTESVKEIVPKYDLESEVNEVVKTEVPDDIEVIDIAQVAFEMHSNNRFIFSLDDL